MSKGEQLLRAEKCSNVLQWMKTSDSRQMYRVWYRSVGKLQDSLKKNTICKRNFNVLEFISSVSKMRYSDA